MKPDAAELTLVPLSYKNILPALGLARKSFGPEFPLVMATYAWHFYRRAGLPDPGLMAKRSTAQLPSDDGAERHISFVTTVIHGRDICWVDDHQDGWGEELRSFAQAWRVCIFRCDDPLPPMDGLILRGEMPTENGGLAYIYSFEPLSQPTVAPLHILRRQRLQTTADFHALSRARKTVGITGVYEAEYWPGIAWGAWGTLARQVAHRDAVFQAIALTESLARRRGARWFCIETSSDRRYASARAMYTHYGLRPMLNIPDFFGKHSDYRVYGKLLVS